MTMASNWQNLYNYKPHNPEPVLRNMKVDVIATTVMMWEDTNIQLFLFVDGSMLVIPEGNSAMAVVWTGR